MLTLPATPSPDWLTTPATVTRFFFLLVTFADSVTLPGPTNDRVSTMPAAFGTPVPALYGVVKARQRVAPSGGTSTPFTVNVASSSCAPMGERPGVPCGTSDGPRQTWSFATPRAVSVPDVGST